jgi:hypothetical protein
MMINLTAKERQTLMRRQLDDEFKPTKICGIGKRLDKPTTVYRIEMPNGKGPYNSGLPNSEEIYWTICKPEPGYDCAKFATMTNEQCGVTEKAFYDAHGSAEYGCSSLKALTDWFGKPAREYLKSFGAKVMVYEVQPNDYLLSLPHGEVVFNKLLAEHRGTLDLVTLS